MPNHIEGPTNPSITRDELFDVLDDFTGASTQSIESLKKLLDAVAFDPSWIADRARALKSLRMET